MPNSKNNAELLNDFFTSKFVQNSWYNFVNPSDARYVGAYQFSCILGTSQFDGVTVRLIVQLKVFTEPCQ